MEILFEILGEFVLQVVVEALLQGGMHTLAAPFRRQSSPWAAALAIWYSAQWRVASVCGYSPAT
jgi:hypothetical protein